jgi:hypothetical protein
MESPANAIRGLVPGPPDAARPFAELKVIANKMTTAARNAQWSRLVAPTRGPENRRQPAGRRRHSTKTP